MKHVVSLIEYIFITKLRCLTTLTPLISYTHNRDDTHKRNKTILTILYYSGTPSYSMAWNLPFSSPQILCADHTTMWSSLSPQHHWLTTIFVSFSRYMLKVFSTISRMDHKDLRKELLHLMDISLDLAFFVCNITNCSSIYTIRASDHNEAHFVLQLI